MKEGWKPGSEAGKHIAAVVMALFNAFDSLLINLLIAKLKADEAGISSLTLLKSYLTDREQME